MELIIRTAHGLDPSTGAISSASRARFEADGFLSIERLIDAETLGTLRQHYDRFVRGDIDCGADNGRLGGRIHQIMFLSKYEEYFRDNPALAAGKTIARQLLGHEPRLEFDFLIDKPPGTLSETPWHQDYAYIGVPFAPAGIEMTAQSLQFWVALDDVNVENGCMQFIPEWHRQPLREHYVASGDPLDPWRIIVISQVDAPSTVACPVPAGGCTIHAYGTPHRTGGNQTKDRSRRAYIFNLS